MTEVPQVSQKMYTLRQCVLTSLALMGAVAAFLTFDPLGPIFARPLEDRFSVSEPERPVVGVIVLGGHLSRVIEGLRLALKYPEAKFLASVRGDDVSPPLLKSQPSLAGRLFLEWESRTTYENATVAARILVPKSGERWIVVTSASHMPRAVGAFRKAGFDVHPWPVKFGPAHSRLSWKVALHEWIGLMAYRAFGWSGSIFPGMPAGISE